MLEDTFEGMEDGEEMEEEAEEEIDKILFELTAGEVISLTHSLYCCLLRNRLNLNQNETIANLPVLKSRVNCWICCLRCSWQSA